jgi:F420-non-reducing hydrogenase large subunit
MELKVDEATRVAGHIGISVRMGKGEVKARVVQREFRGFEPLLRGRPLEEAPLYTSRICGICQVAHALASVRAVEDGLSISVSPEVEEMREVANLAGTIQSHLLHLFLLIAPFGLGTEPAPVEMQPKLSGVVRSILMGRDLAQRVITDICGRAMHPITIVPGGLSKGLGAEDVARMASLAGSLDQKLKALSEDMLPMIESEAQERGVALRTRCMRSTDGGIVVQDPDGSEFVTFDVHEYGEHIAEMEAEEGYGGRPYLKSLGYPEGLVRVGPLARLNMGGGKDPRWKRRHESIMYSYARIVESVLASERIGELLAGLRSGARASPAELKFRGGEGFGAIEAPRGTLLHHYLFSRDGVIKKADIITPTAFNSPAIEKDIEENLSGMRGMEVDKLRERALQVLRDYDPCIPCAAHAVEVIIDR